MADKSFGVKELNIIGTGTPSISSPTNTNLNLTADGTGKVVFTGNSSKGAGQFILNCEENSHGITIKGPPHSAAASYTLTLPNNDGDANQVLKTNGSGVLSWTDNTGGGVTVQDEGSSLSTTGTTLNFVGSGVVASGTGATKTITISGGSGSGITAGISTLPRPGYAYGTTAQVGEGLEPHSNVAIGNTIAQKLEFYYDGYNQMSTIKIAGNLVHSSNRNSGVFKIRTDAGINNSTNSDSIYQWSSGASIQVGVANGQVLLCTGQGNSNLGEGNATGDHKGCLFKLDGTITNAVGYGTAFNLKLMRKDDGNAIEFVDTYDASDPTIGSISLDISANTTAYNTSSDYRIKENVVGITSALDKINQLRPVNFNFIGKTKKLDGFIAHEVQAVVPYAVTGEKDAVKFVKDGDLSDTGTKEDADRIAALPTKEVPNYQQLDYSKLVTLLTASIQELSAKNDALEARIKTLEG